MSAPDRVGAVVVVATRSGQFAVVTLGDVPAGSVATFAGPAEGAGDVDEGKAASPPPPQAAIAAKTATTNEKRKTSNLVFMGFPATCHKHNKSMAEISLKARPVMIRNHTLNVRVMNPAHGQQAFDQQTLAQYPLIRTLPGPVFMQDLPIQQLRPATSKPSPAMTCSRKIHL
ncbi:hypothetical protein [Polaromonas sp.]|uniref:hypothetical protein n=1 Tax=Polaromonas sp. TaxID=1869339 RepID=UPI00179AA811|nr:hypothetical protein [Polaromonas sp.]NML86545.1 hypothetical protein [Polaromonas sp.]